MRQFLLTLTLLCLTLLPVGAQEPYTQIPPPKLVPCASPANCDRDPKHLEAFVEGFYKWYIDTENAHFDDTLSKKQKSDIKKKQRTTLNALLTPRFLKWEKVDFSDNAFFHHDFCAPDGDIFLCAQDWNDHEIQSTQAQTIVIGQREAIILFDPTPKLSIRLRATQGKWKIDGVMTLDQ